MVVGTVGLSRPRWLAPIFTTWMMLIYPIAWLMSNLLLAIVFYGLVTPLGLLFRLLKRDALDRRWHKDQDSYWSDKTMPDDSSRYLRQY